MKIVQSNRLRNNLGTSWEKPVVTYMHELVSELEAALVGRLAFLSNTKEVKIQLNLLTHDVLCGKDLRDDSFLPASQKETINKFNTVVFFLTNRTETWI